MPRLPFAHGVALACAVALVARLAVIAATPHYVPRTDSADYDRIAVSLARTGSFPPSLLAPGGGPSAFRPPAFPIALAAVDKLIGSTSDRARWDAGRVLEALLGTAVVLLTCLLGARLWGPAVGLLGGLVAALSPPLVLVGSSLMSEPMFMLLLLAAVLAGLAARRSRHPLWWAVVAGGLVGVTALTRSNGLLLVIPLAALVWSERPLRRWRSLRRPAVLVAGCLAVLVPWTVRNAALLHAFVPTSTETGYALQGTYNSYSRSRSDFPAMWIPPVAGIRHVTASSPHLNEARISSRLDTVALNFIGAHPAYLLKVAWWDTLRLLNLTGTSVERWYARYEAYPGWLAKDSVYVFWLIELVALVAIVAGTLRRGPAAVWGVPAMILISAIPLAGGTRYRAPADPFIVLIASAGLVHGWRTLRARTRTLSTITPP